MFTLTLFIVYLMCINSIAFFFISIMLLDLLKHHLKVKRHKNDNIIITLIRYGTIMLWPMSYDRIPRRPCNTTLQNYIPIIENIQLFTLCLNVHDLCIYSQKMDIPF